MTDKTVQALPEKTPTRLAIEAALAASDKANWSAYGAATSSTNMRHLLAEHDTEVAQLKAGLSAGLAVEKERVRVLRGALQHLFNSYKCLADSGDAGNWKLEEQPEGIKALAALTQTQPKEQSK